MEPRTKEVTNHPMPGESAGQSVGQNASHRPSPARMRWVWNVILMVVLLAGAGLRLVGLNWDEGQHLHPDERFLTMVVSSIEPVKTLGQYFDTATSTLNPNNRGYGFYVYGTLPLFITRYVAQTVNQAGYDEIYLVGRVLSALFDLGTVLLVYLIAMRLYRKPMIGVLAAAFASFSVLPIQLSHYFTVDTFSNFFSFLAVYFAVCVFSPSVHRAPADDDAPTIKDEVTPLRQRDWLKGEWNTFWPYAGFGIAFGLALACKVNVAPLMILLPGAAAIAYFEQPKDQRHDLDWLMLRNLVLAGLLAFLVFRVFQPYAFSGPGIFGLKLNPKWLSNMGELAGQSTGDVDFPPALQWARRPLWFSWVNMVIWGLGLPLGLTAWAGFLWMGYRMLRGEWRSNLLLWVWTALYFTWQSINFTCAMRYQLLVYPSLAILAAWLIHDLSTRRFVLRPGPDAWAAPGRWQKLLVGALELVAVWGTLLWAVAFVSIYQRPMTRVEASRWFYQNIPGPINLKLAVGNTEVTQPVAYSLGSEMTVDNPLRLAFTPGQDGWIEQLKVEHLMAAVADDSPKTLLAEVYEDVNQAAKASATLVDPLKIENDSRGRGYVFNFTLPFNVRAGRTYTLVLKPLDAGVEQKISGSLSFEWRGADQTKLPPLYLPEPAERLQAGKAVYTNFSAVQDGSLKEISIPHLVDLEGNPGEKIVKVSLYYPAVPNSILASGELRGAFLPAGDARGKSYTLKFEQPVALQAKSAYALKFELLAGEGSLALYGTRLALESTWDDALPLSLDGYSAFDTNTGIYRSDLNLEMYWDDTLEKRDRFVNILNQTDTVVMTSNRQWGTTVRVPERYPLTAEYYRDLLGCPAEKEITWCYSVAEPGQFKGELGFELVKVFQSDPTLAGLRFNSQFAEEAFTVYDAPKVMIFRKTASYDPQKVAARLSAVDLSYIVKVTPRKAKAYPANLLLPANRLAEQRAGGTWAELFDRDALFNQYPALALVLWYLTISILGWMVYPLLRLALRGLPDRGYPLARTAGMVLLAYPTWLAGSAGLPFDRLTISCVFGGLLLLNVILAWHQRHSLAQELRERWKYYLVIELVWLGFFVLFLLVRLGNPDLWHPYKGGEKPMDFSYLNAVLKSTTFPPYDPWFSGGYINYYYYGFVLVGVPVKWLGIVPSIAYNLILPTLFSMVALGAFCFGWNILSKLNESQSERRSPALPYVAGLTAAVAMLILGNLGTYGMLWNGLARLGADGASLDKTTLLTQLGWIGKGLVEFIGGARLPFYPGDWYWIPSRVIPGEPITEFPCFTFLYADPHAHMIAMPVTLLALMWALSVFFGRWQWGEEGKSWLGFGVSMVLGAVTIGALWPTNSWDLPFYLLLGCLALGYTALTSGDLHLDILKNQPLLLRRILAAALSMLVLFGLTQIVYRPFVDWFGQGYSSVMFWEGDHTPNWSYWMQWGLFLFVMITWLVWETWDWMAHTPVSALARLRPYLIYIQGGGVALMAVVTGLTLMGVSVAWLPVTLSVWAAILLLRPGQPLPKRALLVLAAAAWMMTLMVELLAIKGDLGRMNMVFKFYLQAWTLLSLSAAAAFILLIPAIERQWQAGWRRGWQAVFGFLLVGAMLFPLMAGADKITDRMNVLAPHTLDGMEYMRYSSYNENGKDLDLAQDYDAILWMQENIQGSPVIVEGHTTEYRWGNRFTIYTGLPGVVGWNWHQRQQRALTPSDWVTDRVEAVNSFYETGSRREVIDFLTRYQVQYIVVGQLEKAYYSEAGLQKFETWNQDLWTEVYRAGDTVIYKVKAN